MLNSSEFVKYAVEQLSDSLAYAGVSGDNAVEIVVRAGNLTHQESIDLSSSLRVVKKIGEDSGLKVRILSLGSADTSVEESIKKGVMLNFPDFVRNVFVTTLRGRNEIIVELKTVASGEHTQEMLSFLNQLLNVNGSSRNLSAKVRFIPSADMPTNTAIIRAIRKDSPITLPNLMDRIQQTGKVVPNEKWLNGRLDTLRRSELLVRTKSGRYALTLACLRVLGSAKGARSPDIERVLALARSK